MKTDSPWLAIASDILAGKYARADKSTLDSLRFGLQAAEFDDNNVVQDALEIIKTGSPTTRSRPTQKGGHDERSRPTVE